MSSYSTGSKLIQNPLPPEPEESDPENYDKTYENPKITNFHELKSMFYTKECKVGYLLKKSNRLSYSRFFPDLTLFNSYTRNQPIAKLTRIIAHHSIRQELTFTTFERFEQVFEGIMSKKSLRVHSRDNDCDTDSDVVTCGKNMVLGLCQRGIENCQRIAKKNESLIKKMQKEKLKRNQSIAQFKLGKEDEKERPKSQIMFKALGMTGLGIIRKKNEFWV